MGLFSKDNLPEFGRSTRHNRPLGDGLHCRWCNRALARLNIHVVICILCDRPNVALGIIVPEDQ